MKYLLIVVSIAFLLGSCAEEEKSYELRIKIQKLESATMYDLDMVKDVIFDSEEQNLDSLKNKSRQLFLKGIDLYKNKKQTEKAIEAFKSSILTFPEAKTYYELGNALMEQGGYENLENALKAFDITKELGFQPVSTVLYNKACAHYMLYSNPFILDELAGDQKALKERHLDQALSDIRRAFSEGFYDTLSIKTDERIKGIAQTSEYKSILLDFALRGQQGNEGGMFALFTKSFPAASDRFEVKLDEVEMKNYSQSISYDFAPFIPEMENVSFGREVSNDFYYVTKLSETPNYTAVIYKTTSFQGEFMPVNATLATYDTKGEVISKVMFSCVCSPSKVKTGKIENGELAIEEYKRIWKEPIDKVSVYDNVVTGHDLVSKTVFTIDESGKIVALDSENATEKSTSSISAQPSKHLN